jgi:hypothetical protein
MNTCLTFKSTRYTHIQHLGGNMLEQLFPVCVRVCTGCRALIPEYVHWSPSMNTGVPVCAPEPVEISCSGVCAPELCALEPVEISCSGVCALELCAPEPVEISCSGVCAPEFLPESDNAHLTRKRYLSDSCFRCVCVHRGTLYCDTCIPEHSFCVFSGFCGMHMLSYHAGLQI